MSSKDHSQNGESSYLSELFAEKELLVKDPSFKHSPILLAHEIDRVQMGSKKMIDLHISKPIKLEARVRLPVKEYPNFNFMGKIIGQNANTLKQMQIETGTKMIIQGAGSLKDKAKEDELRKEGGKYAHLHEDLHILVEAYGMPSECYYKISLVLNRLNEFFMMENIGDGGKLGPMGLSSRGMVMPAMVPRPHIPRGPISAASNSPGTWHSPNPRSSRPSVTKSSSQSSYSSHVISSSSSSHHNNNSSNNNSSLNHNTFSSPSHAFANHSNDTPGYLRAESLNLTRHPETVFNTDTEEHRYSRAIQPPPSSLSSSSSPPSSSYYAKDYSGRLYSNIKYHPYK